MRRPGLATDNALRNCAPHVVSFAATRPLTEIVSIAVSISNTVAFRTGSCRGVRLRLGLAARWRSLEVEEYSREAVLDDEIPARPKTADVGRTHGIVEQRGHLNSKQNSTSQGPVSLQHWSAVLRQAAAIIRGHLPNA